MGNTECDCKKNGEKCDCDPGCSCGCNPREGLTFDKFMDSILMSENFSKTMRTVNDSPQRIRAKRNQERPLNRIVVRDYE